MDNVPLPTGSDKALKRHVPPPYSAGLDISVASGVLREEALSEAFNISFASLPGITQRRDRLRYSGGIENALGMGARDDGTIDIMNGSMWSLWDGQYLYPKYQMPTQAPVCFARFTRADGTMYICANDFDRPRAMDEGGALIQVMSAAPAGRLVAAFCDRLFIASGRTLHYSRAGDPTAFGMGDAGSLTHSAADGGITALSAFEDRLLVFTRGSCHELHGKAGAFELRRIDSVGCAGPKAVCAVGGALYFMDPGGVYCYAGATPRCISKAVQPYIDGLPRAAWDSVALGAGGGRVYLSLPAGTGGLPAATLAYDAEADAWHTEDIVFQHFAAPHGKLHAIATNGRLYVMQHGEAGADTLGTAAQPINWSFATKPYRLCAPGGSFAVRGIDAGYTLPSGSSMAMYASEGSGFVQAHTFTPAQNGVANITLPAQFGRVRGLALRFAGSGAFMLDGLLITAREWGL